MSLKQSTNEFKASISSKMELPNCITLKLQGNNTLYPLKTTTKKNLSSIKKNKNWVNLITIEVIISWAVVNNQVKISQVNFEPQPLMPSKAVTTLNSHSAFFPPPSSVVPPKKNLLSISDPRSQNTEVTTFSPVQTAKSTLKTNRRNEWLLKKSKKTRPLNPQRKLITTSWPTKTTLPKRISASKARLNRRSRRRRSRCWRGRAGQAWAIFRTCNVSTRSRLRSWRCRLTIFRWNVIKCSMSWSTFRRRPCLRMKFTSLNLLSPRDTDLWRLTQEKTNCDHLNSFYK